MKIMQSHKAIISSAVLGRFDLEQFVDFLRCRLQGHGVAIGVQRCKIRQSFEELGDQTSGLARVALERGIVAFNAVFLASFAVWFCFVALGCQLGVENGDVQTYFDSSSLTGPAAGTGFLMSSSRMVDWFGGLVFVWLDPEYACLALWEP